MDTLMGHAFCKGGYSVTMIDLPERARELRANGRLVVIFPDGSESWAAPERISADYSEAGRPLELDALMLAVLELAELTGKETPAIRHVYACASLLNGRLLTARPGVAAQ